ncbi:MAG TPA: DUF4870 domain-containing protein [Gemmataceae bacterium]|nr:DUF4870 domain-containing protein [Gemmataceae bacterium]
MPIAVVCPACKAKLKAPDNLIGKTVKCPGCTKPVLVKAVAAPTTPVPAVKKPVKQPAPPVLDDEPFDDEEPVKAEVPARPKKKPRIDEDEVEDNEEAASPPPPGGPSTDKERGTAMWIHLLPVVLSCCGGIGTLISLIMWISKRKESLFIDHHGKTWLNFLINIFAVSIGLVILSTVLGIVAGFMGSTVAMIVNGLFGLLYLALAIYVIVMQIMVALKAKKGEWAEYRVLFKVMK